MSGNYFDYSEKSRFSLEAPGIFKRNLVHGTELLRDLVIGSLVTRRIWLRIERMVKKEKAKNAIILIFGNMKKTGFESCMHTVLNIL